jgi:hypothetical protein
MRTFFPLTQGRHNVTQELSKSRKVAVIVIGAAIFLVVASMILGIIHT